MALGNKQRKTHELWLAATTLLKNFSKRKGWPSQSLINQSLLRKSAFGSGLTKTVFLRR